MGAKVMNEVLLGVRIEPPLQPLEGEVLTGGSNEDVGARVDQETSGKCMRWHFLMLRCSIL